jgi:hypothetical protein
MEIRGCVQYSLFDRLSHQKTGKKKSEEIFPQLALPLLIKLKIN